jgi:hypothetical protein
MTSILTGAATSAAQVAHSITASLLSTAQIAPGGTIPAHPVKEDAPDSSSLLDLKGRNMLVSRNALELPSDNLRIPKDRGSRGVHRNLQCSNPKVHRSIREIQRERCERDLCYRRERRIRDEVSIQQYQGATQDR